MIQDPEVEAMGNVAAAIEGLEDEAKARILQWAAQRYGVSATRPTDRTLASTAVNATEGADTVFQDFAALFDAADPKDGNDKALVAGYWFQVGVGGQDFESQPANDALKDLGHGLPNITKSLGRLQKRKPALVRQTKKSGKSKQARKKYRVTAAGISVVQAMLSGRESSENGEER